MHASVSPKSLQRVNTILEYSWLATEAGTVIVLASLLHSSTVPMLKMSHGSPSLYIIILS